MITKLRDKLADTPVLFSYMRKLLEFNFKKQKALVKKHLDVESSGKILDIGCGTGEFASLFKPDSYTGIDISEKYIAYAGQQAKGHFLVKDARQLDFPDQTFAMILIMAIIHHLNDQDADRVLAEAARLIEPDGRILLMEDAKLAKLETPLVRLAQHFDKGDYIRSPEDYRQLLRNYFNIKEESEFRSGIITYYLAYLIKKA